MTFIILTNDILDSLKSKMAWQIEFFKSIEPERLVFLLFAFS